MMLAARSQRFSWIDECILLTSAALVVISISSTTVHAQGLAEGPSASRASQSIPAWQKAAGGKREFEIASIRPTAPNARIHTNTGLDVEDSPIPRGGRFSAIASVRSLIQFAYRLNPVDPRIDVAFAHQPKWISTERFAIEAKAADANVNKDQMRMMMQSLLADRFKLVVHFETDVVSVIALVLDKPGKLGPRLRPHSEGPSCDAKLPPVDFNSSKIPDVWIPVCNLTNLHDWTDHTVILGSRNTTMDVFAAFVPTLERFDRTLINQTGLAGSFDIELYFTPYWVMPKDQSANMALEYSGPTFFEALRDQLGLKLISTRAPVETPVIDHVEEPSPN
jgi:bla regulator protein blaR1